MTTFLIIIACIAWYAIGIGVLIFTFTLTSDFTVKDLFASLLFGVLGLVIFHNLLIMRSVSVFFFYEEVFK